MLSSIPGQMTLTARKLFGSTKGGQIPIGNDKKDILVEASGTNRPHI